MTMETWKDGEVGTVHGMRVRTWKSQIDGDWLVVVGGNWITPGEARRLAELLKGAAHICETDGDPEGKREATHAE
jgi:hypothetical protein